MKSTVIVTTLLAIVAISLAPVAEAEVPRMISYQGRLTDDTGDPLNATVSIVFSIYDSNSGLVPKWSEIHSSVTVSEGLFNVILGMGTPPVPIEDSVFNQPERWLGISVDGGDELQPRTRLTSVGYAHRVNTVDGATGGTVSGDVTVQSNLEVDGDIHSTGTITSGNSITIDGTLNTISSSTDKVGFTDDSLVEIGGLSIGSSVVGPAGIVVSKTINSTYPIQGKGVLTQVDNPGSGWTWGGDFKVNKPNDGSCLGVAGVVDLDGGIGSDFAVGVHGYATSNVDATGVWAYARVDSVGSGLSIGGQFDAHNYSVAGTDRAYGVYAEAMSDAGAAYGGWFKGGTPATTGVHYGIYATAEGAGSNYAGYFDGRVAVEL